jgi:hypothetical protein
MWLDLHTLSSREFGPFISLFIPWVHIFFIEFEFDRPGRYQEFVKKVFDLLAPDFFYVTITMADVGVTGLVSDPFDIPPNLFVLSQGGKGHVPLLLFAKELRPEDFPIRTTYDFDMIFLGTRRHHPIRRTMTQLLRTKYSNTSIVSFARVGWMEGFARAKLVMCPRGYGRSSYRIGEVLQMGMIPMYIYNDLVWLPYYDSINWSSFAYVAHISDLEAVLERATAELTVEEVKRRRERVWSMYETHWSSRGVIGQILGLLQGGFAASDLRCCNYSKKVG